MSLLRVQHLGKRFGTVVALDDVSLEVAAGTRTAVVGSSGSGKTTLLRLIAGFEAPDSGTIEIMQQDFVRTARAKGLPESWVIGRHALRGAIIPVVSYLGPAAAAIMTGSFVVEVLFAIPGMGQWFVKGAVNRDYSVVLGTAIVYFGLVIVFNLLVDLAYAWLDPRVRQEGK